MGPIQLYRVLGVLAAAGCTFVSAIAVSGCDQANPPRWDWWRPVPAREAGDPAVGGTESAATAGLARQGKVRFNVLRVDVPQGGLQRIEDIWAQVGASTLTPAQSAAMRDNGFRIGIGEEGARDPIRRRIESLKDVRSKLDQALPSMSREVEMFITDAERDWTLFYVTPDGKMSGQSFDGARAVIKFTWTVDSSGSDAVAMRVEPEMRQAPGQMRFQKADERWQYRPEYRGRVFRELAFETVIPKSGFLMLGPTDEATRLPLLGRPFFIEPSSGGQRESVYIISPIVTWTGALTTDTAASAGE